MSNDSVVMGWRTRWNGKLMLFLRQRVRARVDVEDLAQETYLRLLRTQDLRGVNNPLAYLLRVAGHVIAEWRNRRGPHGETIEVEDALLVDGRTPEFELDARISQDRVNQVLAAASPMMRAVLMLRLRDGRAYKDIAKDLGITDRQVKRYLARGYESLRSALED